MGSGTWRLTRYRRHMNTHSKAKLAARSRAKMVRRTIDLHQPVGQVAEVFGISERSAYKWRARFRDEGTKGLYDSSSRPKRSRKATHPLRIARVLALRRRKLPAFQFAKLAKSTTTAGITNNQLNKNHEKLS